MNHTPGPWKLESTTLDICRLIVSIETVNCEAVRPTAGANYTIAYIPTDYETKNQKANARLIATAPELLEACKWFMQALTNGVLVRDITNDDDPDWAKKMIDLTMQLQKTQAAIQKTEEQS